MVEPTIVTILRMDHERGEHEHRPNAHCADCPAPVVGEGDVPAAPRTMINMQTRARVIE